MRRFICVVVLSACSLSMLTVLPVFQAKSSVEETWCTLRVSAPFIKAPIANDPRVRLRGRASQECGGPEFAHQAIRVCLATKIDRRFLPDEWVREKCNKYFLGTSATYVTRSVTIYCERREWHTWRVEAEATTNWHAPVEHWEKIGQVEKRCEV